MDVNSNYSLESPKKGILNVLKIVENYTTNDKILFEKLPNYLLDDSTLDSDIVLKDLYSSIVYLLMRVDEIDVKMSSLDIEFQDLKKEHYKLKEESREYTDKTKGDISHIDNHIVALEANLRILRHTLTYGDFADEDLPNLKKCYLAGGDIGKL